LKIIPKANGTILEIGIGSGLNLPLYNSKLVESLVAIDPSNEILELNNIDHKTLGFNFEFIQAFAEYIPASKHTFDTVVITYSLCTITNIKLALSEIKRVLKPNGKLLFCEHGIAPDEKTVYWQNRINPIWKKVGGGCNLNKDIPKLILENGFKITQLDKMYIPGWKPASFNYWGVAEIK
ncbi:MAG: methyltransferase domain-containing protein, partial [Flavobacteriaceae bacterium]|nr:methyltransferase domain-containing protein [Flavobacteriaceae bacterium]